MSLAERGERQIMAMKRLSWGGIMLLAMLMLTMTAFAQRSDTDGDGVLNNSDKCPTVPGLASNGGCPLETPGDGGGTPDQDGDGVPDYVDQCPDQPGTGYTNGCPVGVPDVPVADETNTPQLVMVWDSMDTCMVGMPLNASGNVNIREQPTTSSAIIGHLAPGDQFEPFFRDYDDNNAIWFGGAPVDGGGGRGWVAGSVVITNGQCVNLPMIIHVDASDDDALVLTVALGDLNLIEPTPEPTAEPDSDLHAFGWDLLTWDGIRVLELDGEGVPTERRGRCRTCDFSFTHLYDKSSPVLGGGDPPASTSQPPPSTPSSPARTLPVLLVISDIYDTDCAALDGDSCLVMLLQLPDFGDAPGQCPPDSDAAKRIPKLLEAAVKGKVFKKVEIHGTARSSDPPQPPVILTVDGDGSVMPQGLKTDTSWDYNCSIVGFAPVGEPEAMGDGSVRFVVDTFVVLPAVQ